MPLTCETCVFCSRKSQVVTPQNPQPSQEYYCHASPPICGVSFAPDGKGSVITLAGSARPTVELTDVACEKHRPKAISI